LIRKKAVGQCGVPIRVVALLSMVWALLSIRDVPNGGTTPLGARATRAHNKDHVKERSRIYFSAAWDPSRESERKSNVTAWPVHFHRTCNQRNNTKKAPTRNMRIGFLRSISSRSDGVVKDVEDGIVTDKLVAV
jgi:hypothetical protein